MLRKWLSESGFVGPQSLTREAVLGYPKWRSAQGITRNTALNESRSISHKSLASRHTVTCKWVRLCDQCRLWQRNSPAAPETTFALGTAACPQSGKGRAIAKRRRNSAAFRRKSLK